MTKLIPSLILIFTALFATLNGQVVSTTKEIPRSKIMQFSSITVSSGSGESLPNKFEIEIQYYKMLKSNILDSISKAKREYDRASYEDPLNIQGMKVVINEIDHLYKLIPPLQQSIDSLNLLNGEFKVQNQYFNWVGFDYKINKAFYKYLYSDMDANGIRTLGTAGLNLGNNAGSIYSEIVSKPISYIYVRLGTILANSNSENPELAQKESAIQRLSMYGGNTSLSIEYPMLWVRSKRNTFNAVVSLHSKGVADFAPLSQSNGLTGAFVYGFEIFGAISDPEKNVRVLGQFIVNKYNSSPSFSDNLGFNKRNFWFVQCVVGVTIKETVKFSLVLPINIKTLLNDSTEGFRPIFQSQIL